ncbi:hypothetical protein [Streptomyces sp. NBC_00239]|uniref:hypothetical protein n=1 Tax=Streptomyces sp. NBC_00239 TaxID=2903640 RepID=UPI002E2BB7DB|nr:hypothetical protein [Streptomyces sp. NBC_00239]
MTDRSTPSGPPRGPYWGQPEPDPGTTGKLRRPGLTHSLAALGGLVVGVLFGIVGSDSTAGSGSQPTTTVPASEDPPPSRTTPEANGIAKTTAKEIPGDGTFLVGREVRPGTYRSTGPASGTAVDCYWARLKGTTGDVGEIIANHAGKGPATVTILDTDKAFQTSGCQTWKQIT